MASGYITLGNITVEGPVVPKLHRKNYAPMIIGIVICVLLVAGVIFLGVYYGTAKPNRPPYVNREHGLRHMDGYERVQPRKIREEEWAAIVVVAETPSNPVPNTGSSTGSNVANGPKAVVKKQVSTLAAKSTNDTNGTNGTKVTKDAKDTLFLPEATGPQAAALVATGADVVVVLHSKRCPACINLLKTLNAGKDQLQGSKIALVESSEYKDLPEGDFKTALATSAIPLIVRFIGGKSVKSQKGSMPLDVFKTSFTDL
jgi:hypothetical protein